MSTLLTQRDEFPELFHVRRSSSVRSLRAILAGYRIRSIRHFNRDYIEILTTCIKRTRTVCRPRKSLLVFAKRNPRFREGKLRKREHRMTKCRRRRREQCANDRGASALHLFMFVFMIRHGNGNRRRARHLR